MRFIFRADASRIIGAGHVMRSSVLAEEAIDRGYECIFIGSVEDMPWVKARVAGLGFTEIYHTANEFFPNRLTDILILDSYEIAKDSSFISLNRWKGILSITDNITPDYHSSIQLKPSLTTQSNLTSSPILLSGTKYILIRKTLRKSVKNYSDQNGVKVLVLGGGSDSYGFVDAILSTLVKSEFNLEVHYLGGRPMQNTSYVKFINHPYGLTLDNLVREVDLVLTTASTLSFEFIFLEVPIGIVCATENQAEVYSELGKAGYASQIGVRSKNGVWHFETNQLQDLLKSREARDVLRSRLRNLLDSAGAARVIDFIVTSV
jgi:spore coat polysaccharide biosynthesis predicted glycosyltransferase SpsG